MTNDEYVIGILGGFGTYATINVFNQYAEIFPAEKEWDRPRVIIDNRCTMPSRVRAILYNENFSRVVDDMADSFKHLIDMGATRIFVACNTAHAILPYIYKAYPQVEQYVVNIIEECASQINEDNVDEVYLLASEGTIESKIFQNAVERYEGIRCKVPNTADYGMLRECIEAVKQNKYSESVKSTFMELIGRHDNIILGCTELPVLYNKYVSKIGGGRVYDPTLITLKKLKKEYDVIKNDFV
jgi:aspartate racemase